MNALPPTPSKYLVYFPEDGGVIISKPTFSVQRFSLRGGDLAARGSEGSSWVACSRVALYTEEQRAHLAS